MSLQQALPYLLQGYTLGYCAILGVALLCALLSSVGGKRG